MITKRMRRWVEFLQAHADSWWYGPCLAFLAALDAFIVIVPTDGLLVGGAMLAPRRWMYLVLVVTLGSSLGAVGLAAVVEVHGLPLLLQISPGIDQTSAWIWSDSMMDKWGSLTLFLVALSPILQQPAVALAGLAGMALPQVFLLVFIGRVLKYGFLAWIATHTPGLLGKLWGIKSDLEDAGVKPEDLSKESPSGR